MLVTVAGPGVSSMRRQTTRTGTCSTHASRPRSVLAAAGAVSCQTRKSVTQPGGRGGVVAGDSPTDLGLPTWLTPGSRAGGYLLEKLVRVVGVAAVVPARQ